MAITTVVAIAEILKNSGFAVEKKNQDFDMSDDPAARPVPKPKIEVLLGKSANFDELMAAEEERKEIEENDERN
ncbi:uncharacterized protein at2g34160 [Phtheirospermum japonicum]|uniref:Uncharacterized protein at2g34160 n=1 Tax=Phtheirospermum japonicum TaxID=374723 RepID=A0A830BKM7_9LAMI|nr:uncharacterized protein at2g34160 [Phtheirospermum japonicum]